MTTKTIQQHWEEFLANDLEPDVPERVQDELRCIFFCGFNAMLREAIDSNVTAADLMVWEAEIEELQQSLQPSAEMGEVKGHG